MTRRLSGRTPLRRVTTLVLGWALVVLGVVGLFLPVLQGVALIVLGVYVLSRESRAARRLLRRLRQRFPGLDARLQAARRRVASWRERRRDSHAGH